jgi:hypothetical protein
MLAAAAVPAIVLLPCGLLRLLIAVLPAAIIVVLVVLLFVFRRTKNDLAGVIAACERQRLQDNVEAVTVFDGGMRRRSVTSSRPGLRALLR